MGSKTIWSIFLYVICVGADRIREASVDKIMYEVRARGTEARVVRVESEGTSRKTIDR